MGALNVLNTQNVLVLGGTGFIGRHAAAALHAAGLNVTIGSRHPERHQNRYACAAFRQARFESLLKPCDWVPLVDGIDVVVNCVGILRQRPLESHDDVHHRAPSALAASCSGANIRLIHTSALGLHKGAKSRFFGAQTVGRTSHCCIKLRLQHRTAITSGRRWRIWRQLAAWFVAIAAAHHSPWCARLHCSHAVHRLG